MCPEFPFGYAGLFLSPQKTVEQRPVKITNMVSGKHNGTVPWYTLELFHIHTAQQPKSSPDGKA